MPEAYAYRSLLAASGRLALGTDYPVENLNPFHTFCAAVFRTDSLHIHERPFQPQDAISREQALRGMTSWAAYSVMEEENKGSLETGKLADFVITPADLMLDTAEQLSRAEILATYIGGHRVYTKE